MGQYLRVCAFIAISLFFVVTVATQARGDNLPWMEGANGKLTKALVEKYGEGQLERIRRGLTQVSSLWRADDGDAAHYEAFVTANFVGKDGDLRYMFKEYESNLTYLYGHMNQIGMRFRWRTDIEEGEILPFHEVFAAYSPSAHVTEDFFKNGLAFVVLLNFPLTTLKEREKDGPAWTMTEWAMARLASQFGERVPAGVNQAVSKAYADADQYTRSYNIWMHHLLANSGERFFPAGKSLLSHWNLRDEIRAQYKNIDVKGGLERQRMIYRVMERIIDQSIPAVVINSPHVDWNPFTNEVWPAEVNDSESEPPADLVVVNDPEPDTRYKVLFNDYLALRQLDPYYPTAPTAMARSFDIGREMSEERVKAIFDKLLSSPLYAKVGAKISAKLGRPLEPFDIWFTGFDQKGTMTEAELDKITKKRYPTPQAFRDDIPNILMNLDFTPERASYLLDNIVVEAARGSGHAMGALLPGEPSRLRTRVEKDGMDYKGYNIAVHELGHNVEQVLSLNYIDHWLMNGVPNIAFTEALAFVFQNKDLALLGLAPEVDEEGEALQVLHDYWKTCEIAAVSLVDIGVWNWMYKHPNATAAELKGATLDIAQKTWNRYLRPAFKTKDDILLGIYTHMIAYPLYLSNYPIGHLIAVQIEDHVEENGVIGPEIERMVLQGKLTPDLWMQRATGSSVGGEALLKKVEKALQDL